MKIKYLFITLLILSCITQHAYSRATSTFGSQQAEDSYIRDTDNNFDANTVENALVELYEEITSTYNAVAGDFLEIDGSNADQDIDIGPYDINVGSITGYGGGLSGLVTGVDISEDSTVKMSSTDTIRFDSTWFTVDSSSVGIDIQQIKTDVNTNTQNAKPYTIYVATYSGTGIDYACDGTDDQVEITAASVAAEIGGTVYIFGGKYYQSSPSTASYRAQTWTGAKPVFYHTAGSDDSLNDVFIYCDTDSVKFVNLEFDGTGFSDSIYWVTLEANADGWLVEDCIFRNKAANTNSVCLRVASGADGGVCRNSKFLNINATYSILNYASKNKFYNNSFGEGGYSSCELRGNDITVVNNTFDGAYDGIVTSGLRHLYEANYFMNLGRNGVTSYADYASWIGNYFYNCTGNGLNMSGGGDWCNVKGNTFLTIGGTGNNGYGLLVSCDYSNVSGNKFSGNMDAAPVYFGSGVHDVNFTDNEMTNVTGNESLLYFAGTSINIQASGNLPITENFDIIVASQTAGGYPDIGVPTHTGTRVTSAGYVRWISTGTTNDTDWKVISQ